MQIRPRIKTNAETGVKSSEWARKDSEVGRTGVVTAADRKLIVYNIYSEINATYLKNSC